MNRLSLNWDNTKNTGGIRYICGYCGTDTAPAHGYYTSGEQRTVTFVNEKYFLEIKDKIDITEESISKIYLIQDSQTYANNAIKALRHQLRLHKGLENADG